MRFLFQRSSVDPRMPTIADKFPIPADQKRELQNGSTSEQERTQQEAGHQILVRHTAMNRGKHSVKVVLKFNQDADEAAELSANMRRAEYLSNPPHYRRLLKKYATDNAFEERSVCRSLKTFLSRQCRRMSARRCPEASPPKGVRFR